VSHERRPTGKYFENRVPLLSQGDLFRDIPFAYPMPADEVEIEEEGAGRRFLSGPLSVGFGLLVTPTCSMRSQGGANDYAHPVRSFVPVRPVTELETLGILDAAKLRLAERRDALINYMYVPEEPDLELPESMALLYMPITLHHEMVVDNRIGQLTYEASAQLQKKLTWYSSSVLLQRSDFDPPMD
jgi:hypothetical protein